jgi:hypothetical protein
VPNLKVPTSGGPAEADERSAHVALLGVNAPIPDAINLRSSKASTDKLERPVDVFRDIEFPPRK